jgi:DNA-binding NarL/FixJ family response regulator
MTHVMEKSVKVVAADDHAIFLEGLVSLFDKHVGVEIVATATNGDDALKLFNIHKPDILLLDYSMPGMPIESIVEMVDKSEEVTSVILLTMHLDKDLADKMFKLGLSGYILKEAAYEDLTLAIQEIMLGGQYLSPKLVDAIRDSPSPEIVLSEREIEVLSLAAKGESGKSIARSLDISERTVRFHCSNSCIKLNATGRSNAIARAIQLNLLRV